jgi:hypothetical protein
MTSCLQTLGLVLLLTLAASAHAADPPAPRQPLSLKLPPPDAEQEPAPQPDATAPTSEATQPPTTRLDSVIVKGKREKKESVEEKLEKAMKPKPPPPPADLNKASEATQNAAAWSMDADAYRDHPGDPTTKFHAPVGDETDGCGADITKGCTPRK